MASGWDHIVELPGDDLGGKSGAKRYRVLFVGKRSTASYPYQVANEHVAGALARALGLWVPESLLYPVAAEWVFFSHFLEFTDVTHGAEARPPLQSSDMAARLEAPTTSWYRHGVVLFDLLVANNDRKPDNIFVTPDRIWLIDHGNALFYRPYTTPNGAGCAGIERLEMVRADLRSMFDRRYHFLDWLADWSHVEAWAERMRALPAYQVQHIVDSVPSTLLRQDERAALVDFLLERLGSMGELVARYQSLFPSLPDRSARN